jgi:lysyl-tRNA synthetase class I
MSKEVRADLEEDTLEKFKELQGFLKDNSRNYGNANTLRLAIRLGHERMEEIQSNRAESIQNFKKWEEKIQNEVDKL